MGCGCGGSQQAPRQAPGQPQVEQQPRQPVEDRSVWNGPQRQPADVPAAPTQDQ